MIFIKFTKIKCILILLLFIEEDNFELEEDDYDLIEENIGVRLQDRVSFNLLIFHQNLLPLNKGDKIPCFLKF